MIECLALAEQHLEIAEELRAEFENVCRDGRFILGRQVELFESEIAAEFATQHAVAVNSGTDALEIVLESLGITAGDEVVTVANTFVATVGAIVACGATPVLVDVDDTENMDPDLLDAAIGSRTKAVIVVHLRGRPAAVEKIADLCRDRGVHLIEDCAQAIGTRRAGHPVGSFGIAGCVSLHPQKNVGALGDGGVIVTSDQNLADLARRRRNHGLESRDVVRSFGRNSRLDALQAAFLRVKLSHWPRWLERRRAVAKYFSEEFADIPLVLPGAESEDVHSFYHYVVRTTQRDSLREFLKSSDISALVHYPTPIHRQPAWTERFPRIRLPRTEEQADQILSLPCHSWLTDADIEHVADQVRRFFK